MLFVSYEVTCFVPSIYSLYVARNVQYLVLEITFVQRRRISIGEACSVGSNGSVPSGDASPLNQAFPLSSIIGIV